MAATNGGGTGQPGGQEPGGKQGSAGARARARQAAARRSAQQPGRPAETQKAEAAGTAGERGAARRARPAGAGTSSRRANGGAQVRSGTRGGQRRGSSTAVRAAPTARGGLPPWALIAMIAVPLAGIVVVLALKTGGGGDDEGAAKKIDPNTQLLELGKQISVFEKEYSEIQRLRRDEDPSVAARQEALIVSMDDWTIQWDTILEPLRDQESGALPYEYQGYQQERARVSRIHGDLAKTGGFFE